MRFGPPFKVDIADDRTVKASQVYRNYTLKIHKTNFPIDLIPITMRGVNIIVD